MNLTSYGVGIATTLLVVLAANSTHADSRPAPAAPDGESPANGIVHYFKAANTDAGDQFGRAAVLSGDGRTLVVAAGLERSGATGVNGDAADNGTRNAGAVYVFRRHRGSWVQEAYLKPGPTHEDQFFGFGYPLNYRAVAVSADGSRVAVGAPGERLGAKLAVGAVYLFARDADGAWRLLQKLQAPVPAAGDYFGAAVDLSGDGRTLRALGLGPRDGEGNAQGQHHLFVRAAGLWEYQTTLEIPHQDQTFCSSGRLSGDGGTVVFLCQSYAPEGSRVITWKRSGNLWTQLPATVLVRAFRTEEVALSFAANRLAFRDSAAPLTATVRVFHWDGAQWLEEAALETPAGLDSGYSSWGSALDFDQRGRVLAIGDFASPAAGAGVSHTPQPGGDNDGAVFVYGRQSGTWRFRRQVKAPDPGWGDGFGIAVSLSGNGRALASGAVWEDSAATGIDGDPLDDAAEESGAVFLME